MKKLTLSKGKAIACLILLCLFLAQSCRKDNLMPNSNDLRNGLSIADAKQYFEKNFQNQIKPKAIMSKGSLNPSSPLQDIIYGKKPMWDASLLKNLSIQTNAVLVPLHKEGVYVNVSKTKMVKFGFLNYMMMYRDDKNNIITEWVELKPTENWLNSKISRKYEGRILVRDWDGKIKRVIDFSNDNINKTLNSAIGSKKLSVTKEALMSGGQQICFIKTTYTVTSGRSTCSCMGHTYEQWAAGECTCGDVPNQGYTTTITYETNMDCLEIEPDGPGGNNPPANPPRSNGSSSSSPIGNGGNGGTNPDDYNPMYCNPDPNYTTPTTPPPPGQDYAIPCSEMAIPDDDMPNLSGLATSLTTTELLIHYYNADPNTDMHLTNEEVAFLNRNTNIVEDLMNYLQAETLETKEFGRWEIKYLTENPSVDFGDFKNNFLPTTEIIANPDDDNWTDPDDEILFDPDQTIYQQYQDSQPWPTVERIIDFLKFVSMRKDAKGKNISCLILAKEQLGKTGYTCSGYLPSGQTFSIYTTQKGVDFAETKKAISYVIRSLSQKIPVLIGVDNRPGAPKENKDNSTDHYVVIVGMGSDTKGKYFQFVDSATDNPSTGASYSNRLYYNATTGKITGRTAIVGYRNLAGMHDYIVTQVRKSIKK